MRYVARLTLAYVAIGFLQQSQAAELQLQPVSHGTWPSFSRGNYGAMKVVSNLAYIAAAKGGLQIIDVSEPTNPLFVGGHEMGSVSVNHVDVRGQHAFVVNDSPAALIVLDVSNPAAPRRLSPARPFLPGATHVAVTAQRAYVAQGSVLKIVDISNPSGLVVLGQYTWPARIRCVRVSDGFAYLGTDSGLVVLDVGFDEDPFLITTYQQVRNPYSIYLDGTRMYVADGTNGLQILAVNAPGSLQYLGGYRYPGTTAVHVVSHDQLCYLATAAHGLQVLNVADPAHPTQLFLEGVIANGAAVHFDSPFLFITDTARGLRVFNVTNPAAPVLASQLRTGGPTESVDVSGNYAYVGDRYGGFHVIDHTNPLEPVRVGGQAQGLNAAGVRVVGDRAYVVANPVNAANQGSQWRLHIFDLTIPTQPVLLGQSGPMNFSYSVDITGSYAYVANAPDGLRILDISVPTNIVEVKRYQNGFTPIIGVQIISNLAYLTGLEILDISSPTNPVSIGNARAPTGDFHVHNGFGYVLAVRALEIYDLSNPRAPFWTGRFNITNNSFNLSEVFVTGTHAYVAAGARGLFVIDVADPAKPVLVGSVDTPGEAVDVLVSNQRVFVADADAGLTIILSIPNHQFSFQVLGSPGTSITLESTTDLHSGAWTPVLSRTLTSDRLIFTDYDAAQRQKFYRAVER